MSSATGLHRLLEAMEASEAAAAAAAATATSAATATPSPATPVPASPSVSTDAALSPRPPRLPSSPSSPPSPRRARPSAASTAEHPPAVASAAAAAAPMSAPGGFACPSCGRVFSKKWNAIVHQRVHSKERPFVCSEPSCSRAYMWRSSLKSHAKSHRKLQALRRGASSVESQETSSPAPAIRKSVSSRRVRQPPKQRAAAADHAQQSPRPVPS